MIALRRIDLRCIPRAMLLVGVVRRAAQQKMERPGITNFTKVDAVVACGGATETAALEGLKNDGFKAVINLRQATEAGANIEENAARAKALGLNYIHIPLNGQAPDDKTVDDFLAAVANKANQPVYIHCGSAQAVSARSGWSSACCRMAGRSRRRPKKPSSSACAARRSNSSR